MQKVVAACAWRGGAEARLRLARTRREGVGGWRWMAREQSRRRCCCSLNLTSALPSLRQAASLSPSFRGMLQPAKLTKLAAQSKRNSFFPTVCVNVSLIFFSFRGTRRNERGLEGIFEILDGGIGRMNEYVYIGEREWDWNMIDFDCVHLSI